MRGYVPHISVTRLSQLSLFQFRLHFESLRSDSFFAVIDIRDFVKFGWIIDNIKMNVLFDNPIMSTSVNGTSMKQELLCLTPKAKAPFTAVAILALSCFITNIYSHFPPIVYLSQIHSNDVMDLYFSRYFYLLWKKKVFSLFNFHDFIFFIFL